MGSRGLAFAAAHSSCFPIIVRIGLTPREPNVLPIRDSDDCCSSVEGGPGEKSEATAATSSWDMLEGWGDRPTSPSLGAVSGMVVLPDVRGDEQDARSFDISTTNNARMTNQRAGVLSVHESSNTSEENAVMGLPEPPDIMVPQGRRIVLATGTEGLNDTTTMNGATNSLCILEHGLGLDTKAEGSIGLHEGATLFAQPVAMGAADYSSATRESHSRDDESSGTSGPRGRNDEAGCGDVIQGGHVLLLSDRVRSRTHTLVVSPDGEAAPAVPGATEVRMSALQASRLPAPSTNEQDIRNISSNISSSVSSHIIYM